MTKFLAVLFLLCVSVGISIVVMIKGWGLQPHSWWWIVGVGIFGNAVISTITSRVFKEDK